MEDPIMLWLNDFMVGSDCVIWRFFRGLVGMVVVSEVWEASAVCLSRVWCLCNVL